MYASLLVERMTYAGQQELEDSRPSSVTYNRCTPSMSTWTSATLPWMTQTHIPCTWI